MNTMESSYTSRREQSHAESKTAWLGLLLFTAMLIAVIVVTDFEKFKSVKSYTSASTNGTQMLLEPKFRFLSLYRDPEIASVIARDLNGLSITLLLQKESPLLRYSDSTKIKRDMEKFFHTFLNEGSDKLAQSLPPPYTLLSVEGTFHPNTDIPNVNIGE